MNPLKTICVSALFIFVCSCGGGNKAEASASEIKEEMPTELKDSTILQSDEANALDKLNNVIDSSSGK